MNRIALGLEYDGSSFHGWQRQAFVPSIQANVEEALSKVAAEPITIISAGRTDKGVHASGQVIHFDTQCFRSERTWIYGTNTFLSQAIRVLWAKTVSSSFHARRSATGRRYRYVIYNHPIRPSLLKDYVHWYYRKLDIQKMSEAARYWLGEHDFSSFRAAECQSLSTMRMVNTIEITRIEDQIVVDITANAFLYHMVRNMVGVLLKIGTGIKPPLWAKKVLEARDRQAADITASPFGLYLVDVQYPEHFQLPTLKVGPWFLRIHEGS